MEIRLLSIDDIDSVLELESLSYESVSGKPLRSGDRYSQWFINLDQNFAVGAFCDQKLVGYKLLVDKAPGMEYPSYWHEAMVVHPDYQGRGIGRKLCESGIALVDAISPRDATYAHIGVDNLAPQKLHEKFGSVRDSNTQKYKSDGRVYETWRREPFANLDL